MPTRIPILESIKAHLLNPIIVLLFAVAVVLFIYGLVEYLYQGKVGDNRAQAIRNIIWGVAGMAIMLSVYGIMTVLTDTIKAFAHY